MAFTDKNSVKLGLMPPLSGLVEMYGPEISRAGQIACQEVNENGGVLGRPLELIIEDDGSLPESAVIAANVLVKEKHCDAIIGNLLSNSRIAVAYRVAEPCKIPYLNFSFYEGSILSHYFFHFAALPNQQIDKMIPYMAKKYGSRMFFAGNNYEWPRGSIDAGKRALSLINGDVVGEEYTPIGVSTADIDNLLDKVEQADPDVFVPYFAGSDQVNLLTRFTERGLKNQMAVVMGHYDEMMASYLTPEIREGFYSSNTYFMSIDSSANENYLKRLAAFEGVTGVWPEGNGILTNFGEGTYLCVKAYAEAVNHAGSLDTEKVIKSLESVEIESPQGVACMDKDTHHAKVNTYLSRCNADGAFSIVESFGVIHPVIPSRYSHQRIGHQATLEEDIRLQARMIEQMSEGILLLDSVDTKILYTNDGANKLLDCNREEAIGQFFGKFIASTERSSDEIVKRISNHLLHVGRWKGELKNLKNNGDMFWSSVSISTFTHPVYGEVWMVVMQDISRLKLLENKLQESENSLKNAQEIALLGGWKLDIESGEVNASEELLKIFELDAASLTLEKFAAVVHPEDLEYDLMHIKNGIEKGEDWDIEHRLLLKDGSIKWVHAIGKPKLNSDGKTLSITGIVQDITERKRQEEENSSLINQLHESQKMEALGKLTGGIAHDYNNMLGIMIGYAQLLEEELHSEPRLAKYAHEIFHAGNRGAKLTKRLLSFSKYNDSDTKQLNINDIIHDYQNMLEKTLTVRVKLVLELQQDLWNVKINSGDMEDALLNLCINAMHAIEERGQLTIKTSNRIINEKDALLLGLSTGYYVSLSVADTGCGIDKDILGRIFEPFFSTKGDKGTGLGLSQVYGFVHRCNGGARAESELGKGTDITLYFPRDYEIIKAEIKPEEESESSAVNNKTILVVDDEVALLSLSSEILKQNGFNVIAEDNPIKALEVLKSEHVDLLLSDILMPEMDGYQLAAIVKENYPDIKIQLISGYSGDDSMDKKDSELHKNILNKPFNSRDLVRKVQSLLSVN